MLPIRRNHNNDGHLSFDNVVCAKCSCPVKMVLNQSTDIDGVRSLQPLDGLHMVNHYGYGMWQDHDMYDTAIRDVVICGPCTKIVMKENPWLSAYLSD
jgi:hypothetical protein